MKNRYSKKSSKFCIVAPTFTGNGNFPPGVLPCSVLKRTFYFQNFRTADTGTANDVADEIMIAFISIISK